MMYLRFAPRRANGFTLVELLVVIVVITLLISILLPSLKQAREVGNMSTCKNQERQLAIAFAAYTSDFGTAYPYANPAKSPMAVGTWNNWSAAVCNPWMANLAPYLGYQMNAPGVGTPKPKVLRCPDNPWAPWNQTAQNTPAPTYGMGGAFPSNYGDQSGVDPFVDGTHFIQPMREAKLLRPSLVCLLGELPNMQSTENSWGTGYSDISIYYLPFIAWTQPAYNYLWANSDPVRSEFARYTRVNHLNSSWNSLMADGSSKTSQKKILEKMAADSWNLQRNTDGLMFWSNRIQ